MPRYRLVKGRRVVLDAVTTLDSNGPLEGVAFATPDLTALVARGVLSVVDPAQNPAPVVAESAREIAFVKGGKLETYDGTAIVEAGKLLATAKRSTAYALDSPIIVPIEFDAPLTFTAPPSGAVVFTAPVSGRFYQQGASTVSLVGYVGPDSISGRLGQVHQADPLQANVRRFALDKTSARAPAFSMSQAMTGLTPGLVYRVEVCPAITGGGHFLTVPGGTGANPTYLAVSERITPFPEAAEVLAVKAADKVHIYSVRGFGDMQEVVLRATVTLPSAQDGRLTVSPDGSKVVVCQSASHTVHVITTGVAVAAGGVIAGGSWAASLSAAYSPAPGTNPYPSDVRAEPGGTHAWITLAATGYVVRMALADGTFGAPVSVPGAQRLAIAPDGATLLVTASQPTSKVYRVPTGAGSIQSVTLDRAAAVVFRPDGAEAYVVNRPAAAGTGNLYRLTNVGTSGTLAISAGVALGFAPQAIDVFPDGRSVLIASDTSTKEQVGHYLTSDLTKYIGWIGTHGGTFSTSELYDVAIGQYGNIATCSVDLDQLTFWPGGQFLFTPASEFHNERAEAFVVAA